MIRRSQTRDNPSDRAAFNVSGSFGTRVSGYHLGSGRPDRVNRPDIRPQPPQTLLLKIALADRGPSTYAVQKSMSMTRDQQKQEEARGPTYA